MNIQVPKSFKVLVGSLPALNLEGNYYSIYNSHDFIFLLHKGVKFILKEVGFILRGNEEAINQ